MHEQNLLPYGIKKYFSFHTALNVFNARTSATRTDTQFLNMLLERIIRLELARTTAVSYLCIITSRIHKNHDLCATGLFHTEQTTAPEETSYELEQRAIRLHCSLVLLAYLLEFLLVSANPTLKLVDDIF